MKQTRCTLTADFQLQFEAIYTQIKWMVSELQQFVYVPPTFKAPKVMGQTYTKLSIFYTWLQFLCSHSKALKSGRQWHYQTLGFFSSDDLPGCHCNCPHFLLVLGALYLQFCLKEVKFKLSRIQVKGLTWPLLYLPLLCFKKTFDCFCSMLQAIVSLHRERSSNEFWSIWLNIIIWFKCLQLAHGLFGLNRAYCHQKNTEKHIHV